MLATIRSDGYPRISPIEPNIFEEHLVIVGMPNTTKFADLGREPRFCLHTATTDTYISDGDVKLFAQAMNLTDRDLHRRFAQDLYERTEMDLREERFDPFYVSDITSASSIELEENKLKIMIWKPGEGERVVWKN
jgi:hypothetical protein